MAPAKKQKREYASGEVVWSKIKGYPYWPGQVEDLKNVTNENVLKTKRKNAVLVKYLETSTYSWVDHADVKPFEKETFDVYILNQHHKNYKKWKEAFVACCKAANLTDTETEEVLSREVAPKSPKTPKTPKSPNKRSRDGDDLEAEKKNKKKKNSASPARTRSRSPKRTARHASSNDKKSPKESPRKKQTQPSKKKAITPPLEGNQILLQELSQLLDFYMTHKDHDKVYRLLKIIGNFTVPDIKILDFQTSKIYLGKYIKKLCKNPNPKVQKIAVTIFNYYDSLIIESKDTEKKEEEENKEEGQEKKEEQKDDMNDDVTVVENNDEKKEEIKEESKEEEKKEENKPEEENKPAEESKPAEEEKKEEVKAEDKMETEVTTQAETTSQDSSSAPIIESSQ